MTRAGSPSVRLDLVPTALLVLGLGAVAALVGPVVPGVNAVVVAFAVGLVVVNLAGDRLALDQRVPEVLLDRGLKLAVILLGAGIDLAAIADVGVRAVGITAAAVIVAMGTAWSLGRRLGLDDRAAVLIGVGTAICGASAIAAVAPVLRADKQQIGLALATVFTFNAVALVTYPVAGAALGLGQAAFGTWAGIGVHDTASAVATGFAFGPEAGQVATVVKLGRTLFLLPLLAIAVAVVQHDRDGRSGPATVLANIPWFVLGFAASATAATLGWLGPLGPLLGDLGQGLIVLVVVGVGLTLRLRRLGRIGVPLVVTGVACSVAVGGLALAAIVGLGVG